MRKLHRESPTSFGGVRLRSGGLRGLAGETEERSSVEGEGDKKEIGTAVNEVVLDLFYKLFSGKGMEPFISRKHLPVVHTSIFVPC